jgi:TrpR family trp operon transcriptional repressor
LGAAGAAVLEHSQRGIAKDLGISLCKITRGFRELKKPNSAFRRAPGGMR